jgi:hypothetical protein
MEAAAILCRELGWLTPERIAADEDGDTLALFLDMLAPQIARVRPRHDS